MYVLPKAKAYIGTLNAQCNCLIVRFNCLGSTSAHSTFIFILHFPYSYTRFTIKMVLQICPFLLRFFILMKYVRFHKCCLFISIIQPNDLPCKKRIQCIEWPINFYDFLCILRFILYTEQIAGYEYYIGIKYLIKLLLFFLAMIVEATIIKWCHGMHEMKKKTMRNWFINTKWSVGDLGEQEDWMNSRFYEFLCTEINTLRYGFLWFIVDYIKLSWNITSQEQQNISMPSFCVENQSENDSVSSYCVETLAKTHETRNRISFKLFRSELCFELSHMCGKMIRYCEMLPKYYRYSTHNPISCGGMKHCCYWDMKAEIDIDIQLLFVNSIVNKS